MNDQTKIEAGTQPSAKSGNGAASTDIVIPLRKPIMANGEEVSELKFREPTAGDIDRIGNPVLIGVYEEKPKVEFDTKVMTAMMSHLAAVPPSSIKLMHTKDWNNAAWALMGFFTPDM